VYRVATPPTPPEGDPRARAAIAPSLEPGETLLWAGQPKLGFRFTLADMFIVPFSLVWASFAILWESFAIVAALNNPMAFPFALAGLPFVAIGLYMLVGRFLYDRAKRARTFYGVTDRRALIVHAGRKKREETSIDLASSPFMSVSYTSDGRGSISFGPGEGAAAPSGLPGRNAGPPSFFRIENAGAVHARIREVARALEGRSLRVAQAEEVLATEDEAARSQLRP